MRLKALGQDVRVCAPPDFREQVEGLGMPFTPVGPELRPTGRARSAAASPTPEQRHRMVEATVAAQFEAVRAAARGCDAIVAGGYLVVAARTVAEERGIRYVMAGYSPNFLPSPHHAPPVYPMRGETPGVGVADNSALWARDAERWNESWSSVLDAHRSAAGLDPVGDVRSHLFTDTPWLAADPVLAPWPGPAESAPVRTGAWILPDERPFSVELEDFLQAGEPPVCFGFGSVRAPQDLGASMIRAARAHGRRAIVARGWADLALIDDRPDCLSIGEVDQQALFRRVAAVVHHGGAGTTTAAALAGAPQVVVPQHVDQHYWAHRIHDLGTAHAPGTPTANSLAEALARSLAPDVAARARSVAPEVRTDAADAAAQLLLGQGLTFGRTGVPTGARTPRQNGAEPSPVIGMLRWSGRYSMPRKPPDASEMWMVVDPAWKTSKRSGPSAGGSITPLQSSSPSMRVFTRSAWTGSR
ncbi:glycosyltransferase [Kitasatospora sp. NPDC051914]|uniref:glycosyltransferase n=1 Tax=Kitasatospora sp. NPDC051914 TaxID=3154945 RepID=UPI0034170DC8